MGTEGVADALGRAGIEIAGRSDAARPGTGSFDPALPGPVDAVVFVLDVASVLGREELALLDAVARDRVPVVFVMPGADPDGRWRAIADRDSALLAAHGVVEPAVSPLDAHPGPGAWLDAVVDRIGAVTGAAPSIDVAFTDTRTIVATTLAHLRDGDLATDVRERRRALVAERDGARREQATSMRSRVQLTKVALLHDVGVRARGLAADARTVVDRAGRRELADFPVRWRQTTAAASATVDRLVDDRLAAVAAEFGTTLPPSPPTARVDVGEPTRRHRGVEDTMTVVVGASAGFGLGRWVVAPLAAPGGELVTALAIVVLGGVVALLLSRARGLAADRGHVRSWVVDVSGQLRADWEQLVLARVLVVEAALGEHLESAHRASSARLDTELADLDARLRRSGAERSGKVAACRRDLATLDAAIAAHSAVVHGTIEA
ncbi:hypothetical protein DW322_06990 [Rhodococcus rhodnii]|uniref:Uncharacterized protein n=1 Tax=Rhodococcus rhodnii TaxID=38312 RepID=A0A6P2CFL4_9NOCA|nr:hypothetical protein DW322_06990 [Rhodococcus rhodnii]